MEALARAAVPDRRRRLQEGLLRHCARLPLVDCPAADVVRRAARGVHAGVPDRVGRAQLSGPAAVQHRPVRLLPGGDDHRRDLDRESGVGGQEDAVPAAGDPAGGRAHHPLQSRSQPRGGLHLHPRLGHRPDLDVAALPAGAGAALRAHHRRLDDRLVAVPALPRHGDPLVGGGDGAVLRVARALSGGEAAVHDRRHPPAQPLHPAARAGARVGDRPTAPTPVEVAGGFVHLLPAIAIYLPPASSRSGRSGARRRGSPSSSEPAGRPSGLSRPSRAAGRSAAVRPCRHPLRPGHARRKGAVGERHPAVQAALRATASGSKAGEPAAVRRRVCLRAGRAGGARGPARRQAPGVEPRAGGRLAAARDPAERAAVSAHVDRGRVPLLGVAGLDRGDQAHPGRTRNVPVRPRAGTSARAVRACGGGVRVRHLPDRVADAPARECLCPVAVAAADRGSSLPHRGSARRGRAGRPARGGLPQRAAGERDDRGACDGRLGRPPAGLRASRSAHGHPRRRARRGRRAAWSGDRRGHDPAAGGGVARVLRHVAFRPAAATQGGAQPGLSRVLGPPGWARADA